MFARGVAGAKQTCKAQYNEEGFGDTPTANFDFRHFIWWPVAYFDTVLFGSG